MYSIQEQFKTDALAQMTGQVRDVQAIAGNFLDLSREVGVLNVRATRASAEQVASAVQKLLGASNPGEFFQIAASVMRPDMQLWTSYIEQLSSIANKAKGPATTLLAPQAAPRVAWPKGEAGAGEAGPQAAAVAETPAVPEQMPLEAEAEAAAEPAPLAPPPAALPDKASSDERVEEAQQAAPETPAEIVEAVKELVDAITGAAKMPPAVMAASTPLVDEPVAPEITVARKSAGARPARKAAAAPAPKKAGPPARSASGRARKG